MTQFLPSKALSIRQPWGWCIIRPDITDPSARLDAYTNGQIKPVENRDWAWNNPGLKYRGPVLIHVGQKIDKGFDRAWANALLGRDTPADLPCGGIIGMADIVDCVLNHDSPWFFGPRAFVLKNARPLPFMPCKGYLGFFNVTYDMSLLA